VNKAVKRILAHLWRDIHVYEQLPPQQQRLLTEEEFIRLRVRAMNPRVREPIPDQADAVEAAVTLLRAAGYDVESAAGHEVEDRQPTYLIIVTEKERR
jgi:hypothetical protein